jgi:hypothetical protein
MDLKKCPGKDVVICPTNHAVYSTGIDSCVLSLFQFSRHQETCGRVTSSLPRTRFEQYGSAVLYYLPEQRTVYRQCQSNWTSEGSSLLLEGGGLLLNADRFSLITKGFQMYSSLQKRAIKPPKHQSCLFLLFSE